MKKNKKFIVAVTVLGVIAIALVLTNSKSTFKRELSDFTVDDTSNVTKIFMSDKNNNNLTLTRVQPGKWLVSNKYPGSKANIELLLGTMMGLQVKETVPKAALDYVIKDLATISVKVEIYQWKYRINLFDFIRLFPHEKLTKVYYVGGPIQSNRWSYMIMEHSSVPFVVYLPGLRGFVTPIYSPIEKYWRDYSIFKKSIQQIESVRMDFPSEPGSSFELKNDANMNMRFISLADNQQVPMFDTLKVMNFLASFRNINFEALLNDMETRRKDSILAMTPYCIISLTDTGHTTQSIKIYRKGASPGEMDDFGIPAPYDMDRLYALVNDGKDFTFIQYFVFDKILRPKSFFLKKQELKKK
ncbi:MAG: hypothetical protein D4R97_01815 [Bacteroidetes bacterium]|nr:MAG: hypothetical protein D4R97_01815 [Bacteroidota bacterium]